ncbi:MAG: DNA primase [Candidatus Berkelbacteria bacterium]|nr:DNA primase [Candidatus Berkelbacteria bacterium]
MMIDQVQEIKDRCDIVEVISSYLTMKKAGANFKAVCPFHNEKSPSLMISPERQSFKCFGCSEGGDVITFVQKIEGVDFYNALKLLADRAGIELKSQTVKVGDAEHKADSKTRVFEINEWAKKVYQKLLLDHPKAEKAREYLRSRGMSEETIKCFEIGYAPDSWDFMLRYLQSKGFTAEEAVASGVAIKSERGKIFDRFRGRIMFPINNIMGNTIAFTSRVLENSPNEAKYINSAESAIYIKGKTIYGLDKAKLAIKEAGQVVMVEGNMDVIACHQAGFRNTVAVSGTALTLDQLKILTRYAGQIVFCFDADNAGQTAMKRAVRLALQSDISTKTISMPKPFKDPDEVIKKDPSLWTSAVVASKPSLEYWIDNLLTKSVPLDVTAKKQIAREILPEIKIIYSDIEKEHYINYLAGKLRVSEKSLLDALSKSKADNEFNVKKEEQVQELENLPILERIFGLIWAEPALISKIDEDFAGLEFDPKFLPLVSAIKEKQLDKEKIKPDISNFYDQITMALLKTVNPEAENALLIELEYLLLRLKSEKKENLKETFARRIKEAEQTGDKNAVKKLLLEFSDLIK